MSEWVDWSEREEHMFSRHGITTAQADEALADPERITFVPDYGSRNGVGIRVVGYCGSLDAVLTIILVPHDVVDGGFYGASGWRSNTKDKRFYHGKGE